MPRGNTENLKKNSDRTPEERKKNARKAGIASGKARREKAKLKDCLEILLERKLTDSKTGKKLTGAEALAAKLFQEAMKGNVKAFEVLRDTAGQKPADVVQQTTKTIDMSQFTTEQIQAMLDEEI